MFGNTIGNGAVVFFNLEGGGLGEHVAKDCARCRSADTCPEGGETTHGSTKNDAVASYLLAGERFFHGRDHCSSEPFGITV